ncbi:MAG: sugar phosphate nucleotidyltransferase, partial [Candidatus Omnitrophota bacterium]|nr:sugar phosphate nucleotidyltransferase [Candidatus Omnitrophota bacterium]
SSKIAEFTKGVKIVNQKKLSGSGNAVLITRDALGKFRGDVVILYGDTPLIRKATLKRLIERHKKTNASCTLLTAKLNNPAGYGRILRDAQNNILRIAEERDAPRFDRVINEVNVGAYCFNSKHLFKALKQVKAENKKKEYYLTDTVSILRKNSLKIESLCTNEEAEALGVNSREELAAAERIVRTRALKKFLAEGVTIIDPFNTYININCDIGRDTIIKPFTVIEENVKIGSRCIIGPFARLRPGTTLADMVAIGNFVELTRSKVGEGTKIKHHSYIGDAIIGREVNIGAGTITANYDGKKKNKTVIKDKADIGSGTIFVAPVVVGKGAVTGAGSVLTKKTVVSDKAVFIGIPARLLRNRRLS